MDREPFVDLLSRLVAACGSRRTLLATLFGAAFAGDMDARVRAETVTGEHRRHRHRRHRHHHRRHHPRPSYQRAGRFPSPAFPCCAGLVVAPSGRCAIPCTSGTCCASGPCVNSVCVDCSRGQRCVNNQCICDAQSCPTGCCSAQGACRLGTSNTNCGTGGVTCADCANPNPICVSQTCTVCSAANRCPSGCCDLTTNIGTCQPGNSNTLCGANGGPCAACDDGTPNCTGGVCT